MFGLFKRSKIESWEIDLMHNVLSHFKGDLYNRLIAQLENKLHTRVLVGASDLPGYIAFCFDPDVFKQFYDPKGHRLRLSNIKVFDIKNRAYLDYNIYVAYGVINGYSLSGGQKKPKIDITEIDIEYFHEVYPDNSDYDTLCKVLDTEEKALLNPSDIYLISLMGKDYYHIFSLEDGDFLAMDMGKVLYKVSHDPLEIIPLGEKLRQVLAYEGIIEA